MLTWRGKMYCHVVWGGPGGKLERWDKIPPSRMGRLLRLSQNLPYELRDAVVDNIRGKSAAGFDKVSELVAGGASWSAIKGHLSDAFAEDPCPATAARCVELAFLYGQSADFIDFFQKVRPAGKSFYLKMDSNLRSYMVTLLWSENQLPLLSGLVSLELAPELEDIEKLVLLVFLGQRWPVSDRLMFLKSYERDLMRAVKAFGREINFSPGEFFLLGARLAEQISYDEDAVSFLGRISKSDPAYPEASTLALRVRPWGEKSGESFFRKTLGREPRWEKRLALLRDGLYDLRCSSSLSGSRRPMMNDLLANPLHLIPEEPEALATLAQILVDFSDLDDQLPNLMAVFLQRAREFRSGLLDMAFWQPLLEYRSSSRQKTLFWNAVARFHMFFWSGDDAEGLLWEAYDGFKALDREGYEGVSWRDLHRSAITFAGKCRDFSEDQRQRLLRQLAVATHDKHVLAYDLVRYLEASTKVPYKLLARLEAYAACGQYEDIELQIIRKKAEAAHLTNGDMDRLWQLSLRKNDHDLSWRLATVLASRGVLRREVEHPWAISGQKRDEWLAGDAPPLLWEHLFWGMGQAEKNFVKAIYKVGHRLPELFHVLGQRPPHRPRGLQKGSEEYEVEKQLARYKWLPGSRRNFFSLRTFASRYPLTTPKFMRVLPQSTWSLVFMNLGGRLGVQSWDWDVEKLRQTLGAYLPRIIGGKRAPPRRRVGRWLRSLSPEERRAWYDLPAAIDNLTGVEGGDAIVLYVARLALLLNQNHYSSLEALRAMRAPIGIIWRMEGFMLSPAYSELRCHLNGATPVRVPASLKALGKITAPITGRS